MEKDSIAVLALAIIGFGFFGFLLMLWYLTGLKAQITLLDDKLNIIKEWLWQDLKKNDITYQEWKQGLWRTKDDTKYQEWRRKMR